MANTNVKLDAPLDFYDHLADILGQTHPDDYQKSVMGRASAATAAPIAGSQPSIQRMGMAQPPAFTATLSPRPMLGRLPSTTADSMEYNAPREMMSTEVPPIADPAIVPRGTLGSKTRGILGTIGQVAGSALVPNLMQWIPGTEQHRLMEEGITQDRAKSEAETARTQAQTGLEGAQAEEAQVRTRTLPLQAQAQADTASASLYRAQHPALTAADLDKQEMDSWLAKPANQGKTADDFMAYKAEVTRAPQGPGTDAQQLLRAEQILSDPASPPEAKAAAQRTIAAVQASKGILREQIPGRDVPLSKDVEAQQSRLRAAGRTPVGGTQYPVSAPGTPPDQILSKYPAQVQSKAKMLLDYKVDATPYMLTRSPDWAAAAEAAAEIDPDWKQSEYPSRLKLLNDFKSGKAAANVRSLNTVVGHLADLKTAAEKLDNRSVQLWNQVANKVITKTTDDSRVTNFEKVANASVNELATLFKGTGATDQEIKEWRATINSSQTPKQLQDGVDTMLHLIASRASALNEQFETGMGKPRDFKLLTEISQKILEKVGIDPAAIDPLAGGSSQAPERPKNVPADAHWDGQYWVK